MFDPKTKKTELISEPQDVEMPEDVYDCTLEDDHYQSPIDWNGSYQQERIEDGETYYNLSNFDK